VAVVSNFKPMPEALMSSDRDYANLGDNLKFTQVVPSPATAGICNDIPEIIQELKTITK